jgi:hypothetical protein
MYYPEIIETIGRLIDLVGVLMIIGGLLIASARYIRAFGGYRAATALSARYWPSNFARP